MTRISKFLTVGLTLAAVAATGASAHDRPAKPEHAAHGCKGKAKVMVVLKGSFVAAAADGASFQLKVDRANRHGRAYVESTQPMTVAVDAHTRYRKNGDEAKLADLAANDRVVVKSKVSRCELRKAADTLPALTARQVVVQAAETAESSESPDS